MVFLINFPRFDQIIVQSTSQQKLLQQNHKLKSQLITNGFPIPKNANKLAKDYVLWVGRSVPFKCPEYFLKLVKLLPHHNFIMIMPGENNLKEKIREMAFGLNNLKLLDYVSFCEIDYYFLSAKCFVNTSESEGFPNTFIQSCLASTPILSLNVNPDDILNEYSMGYCCDGDIQKAVKFLDSLDKSKIETMGKNALSYVNEKHSLPDKVNEYNNIFVKLMN